MTEKPADKASPATAQHRPIPASALPLPRDTTPTWEVELLISGVAVFAMLQLPGWLDEHLLVLQPRLSEVWAAPLTPMHAYLKSAAIILALSFVAHLLLRAHWIALIGLHSVFPEGIDWTRTRQPPIAQRLQRKQTPDVPTAIELADNRATVVFAVGVSVAVMLLYLTAMIAAVYALAVLLVTMTGWTMPNPFALLFVALFVWLTPFFLATTTDSLFGRRLKPNGLPARMIVKTYRLSSYMGLRQSKSIPLSIVLSQEDEKHHTAITLLPAMIIGLMVFLSAGLIRHPETAGNYEAFPLPEAGDVHAARPGHYANRRDPLRDALLPFIQSDLPGEHYLRLQIPYDPVDDAMAMEGCKPGGPDVKQARLDCVAALYRVELDGEPVPGLVFDASVDDRSNRPTLQAMIDIRALTPGRHELSVSRTHESTRKSPNAPPQGTAYRIPFWR